MRAIIFLLLPLLSAGQREFTLRASSFVTMTDPGSTAYYAPSIDSLYTSLDKPSSTWEDNAGTLGMKFTTAQPGTIKALKFYKVDNISAQYSIMLWNNSGVKLTTVFVTTSAIGWIRLPVNIPVGSGTFIIGVYSTNKKYGYRNAAYPRTKGNLSGLNGQFEYANTYPGRTTGTSYYLDVVFQSESVTPATVILPTDTISNWTTVPITITGKVSNAVSWSWEVLDSVGTCNITGLNTLSPSVTAVTEYWLILLLKAAGSDGVERAATIEIEVKPDENEVVGYLMRSGRIIWRRKPVFL